MTQVTLSSSDSELLTDGGADAPRSSSVAARGRSLLDPASPALVYIGVAVTIIGFVLVLVAWSKVAGEINVALQTPYLISAGFTGLGLIMTGLLLINVATKRQEAARRAQQTSQLTAAIRDLQRSLDDR